MFINKCLKRFSHYLDRLPKLGSKLGVIPLDFLGFDLAILDLQKLNHLPQLHEDRDQVLTGQPQSAHQVHCQPSQFVLQCWGILLLYILWTS